MFYKNIINTRGIKMKISSKLIIWIITIIAIIIIIVSPNSAVRGLTAPLAAAALSINIYRIMKKYNKK